MAILGLVLSCKQKADNTDVITNPKPELVMYKPSEMATFMNAMYVYNQQLRAQILAKDSLMSLPLDLSQLHRAKMSNGHERSYAWSQVVDSFIVAQESVTKAVGFTDAKLRFNTAINNCIACHKTECTGPIPKIKKLLIRS